MSMDDDPVAEGWLKLAEKYVWWKPAREVAPDFFLGHVMNRATWADQSWVEKHFTAEILRDALRGAAAGVFDPASWHYWHYRLGWAEVPEMPRKVL